jgi:hypothetical protein
MQSFNYKVYLYVTSVFNKGNFLGNKDDISANNMDSSLVFVPPDKAGNFEKKYKDNKDVLPICTQDDLALGLIMQPYYKVILKHTEAGKKAGVDFYAVDPELAILRCSEEQRVKEKEALISEIHRSFSWRITAPMRAIVSFMRKIFRNQETGYN